MSDAGLEAAVGAALLLALGGLVYWQVQARPGLLLRWLAWSAVYSTLAALALSLALQRVPLAWSLLLGPILAALQVLRHWAYSPAAIPRRRNFSYRDVSHPWGDRAAAASILIAVAIFAWVMVWPEPYDWAMGTVGFAPWIATLAGVAWRREIVAIARPDLEHRPSLGPLILVGVVGYRVVFDANLSPHTPGALLSWGVGGGTLLLALWMLSSSTLYATPRIAIGAALLALTVAFGSVLALNVALDRNEPEYFQAIVTEKRTTYGRGGGHELTLAHRFEPAGSDRLRVSGARFGRISIGASICAARHRGALGVGWYEFVRCAT